MPDHRSTVSVAGKDAIVIGGTTGIGRGIARAFAADGANVIATSRSADSVETITDELREYHGSVPLKPSGGVQPNC